MKCKKVKELLLSYEEGQLEKGDAQEVSAHLSSCAACAGELESLRKVLSSLSRPLPDPGDKYWSSFHSAVLAELDCKEETSGLAERIRGLLFPDLRRLVYVVSGASAVILVAVALVFFPRIGDLRNDFPKEQLLFENEDSRISVYSLSEEELAKLSQDLTSAFETTLQEDGGETLLYAIENSSPEFVTSLTTLSTSELSKLEDELKKVGPSIGRSQS
ncbi:MAG: zf-HC2 domain-containing protein [Candidatus Eisenbacteria bacterium]|nr:zf-HC2 domain-containing protein [Candidatus Eisenbacteria bacterium]